jgi:hypothetical protein
MKDGRRYMKDGREGRVIGRNANTQFEGRKEGRNCVKEELCEGLEGYEV